LDGNLYELSGLKNGAEMEIHKNDSRNCFVESVLAVNHDKTTIEK
jgi:hypothetical protein